MKKQLSFTFLLACVLGVGSANNTSPVHTPVTVEDSIRVKLITVEKLYDQVDVKILTLKQAGR
jgi:hypothetical protein